MDVARRLRIWIVMLHRQDFHDQRDISSQTHGSAPRLPRYVHAEVRICRQWRPTRWTSECAEPRTRRFRSCPAILRQPNPHDHGPFAPARRLPVPTFHADASFFARICPDLCHRRREKSANRAASRYAAGLRIWCTIPTGHFSMIWIVGGVPEDGVRRPRSSVWPGRTRIRR
jgi:hypothetical protein